MGPTRHGGVPSPCFKLLLLVGVLLHCTYPAIASRGILATPGRALQQAANSSCPVLFRADDLTETIARCRRVDTSVDPNGLLFNLPCCNSISALLYKSRVRYANTTDQLLVSEAEAAACMSVLQASLESAGVSKEALATCDLSSTSLWQPACGGNLTTVSAFRQIGNYSYPGSAGAACWNKPNCTACTAAVDRKIASLQYTAADPSVFLSGKCQELARVALVTATWPILLANSISACLWNTPIENISQSPTCTTLDLGGVDYTPLYNACGPPQVRSDYCCSVLQATYTQLYATWTNTTGLQDNELEAEACLGAFRSQLASRGIEASKVDTCHINSYVVLNLPRCKNNTELPAPFISRLEAHCAPGQCSNCSQTLFGVSSSLTGPATDQATFVYCSTFVGAHYYHLYGPGGITDRVNCYWNIPPEVRLRPIFSGRRARRKDSTLVAVVVSCVLGLGVGLLGLVGFLVWFSRKQSRVRKRSFQSSKLAEHIAISGQMAGAEPLQWFLYQELKAATLNFDKKRWLGKGGSGLVYLGVLPEGQLVAVKEITKPSTTRGVEEFISEVSSMASCRHRHIVAPKGVHASENHCVVVYEYIPNGSLDDHLFSPRPDAVVQIEKRIFLDWPQRLKIALGTAKGLAYLHEDCNPRIIHRDVKPSNILLSEDLEAKVADFGLAKFTQDDETHVSTGVRGTWGYISPEYVAHGQVSEKSDVYSFGVVLLSLVSGRRPMETGREEAQVFLTEWAWDAAESGDFLSLVDPGLASAIPEHENSILVAVKVGLMCVHTVVSFRPTMRECVGMLSQQMEVPPLPQRPITLFTVPSNHTDKSSSFITNTTRSISSTLGSKAQE